MTMMASTANTMLPPIPTQVGMQPLLKTSSRRFCTRSSSVRDITLSRCIDTADAAHAQTQLRHGQSPRLAQSVKLMHTRAMPPKLCVRPAGEVHQVCSKSEHGNCHLTYEYILQQPMCACSLPAIDSQTIRDRHVQCSSCMTNHEHGYKEAYQGQHSPEHC